MPWRHMGKWRYSSTILDLGTRWRRVLRFIPRPLYPQGKSPCTDWIGGWVGPRTGLDDVERRNILILPGLELWPFGRPARSQSLYRQRYPPLTTWATNTYVIFKFIIPHYKHPLAGNNNTEEGNHTHKNNKTYKEDPGQVQKTNYIDWTSGQHSRIMV
jgi:hypothetical protein